MNQFSIQFNSKFNDYENEKILYAPLFSTLAFFMLFAAGCQVNPLEPNAITPQAWNESQPMAQIVDGNLITLASQEDMMGIFTELRTEEESYSKVNIELTPTEGVYLLKASGTNSEGRDMIAGIVLETTGNELYLPK